jgi:putative transcriptional regulator
MLPGVRRPRQLCSLLAGGLAALLLPAPWHTTLAADQKSLTSIVITARSELSDPYFGGSMVLVLNNLGPAPAGLIINRPTALRVAQVFPDLKGLASLGDRVYFGGPVELEEVWFLFRASSPPTEHAVRACEGVYLSASRQLLMQLLGRDKPMAGLRIFVGHAGWGPGQLEAEIARGDWKLSRAAADAIFNGKADRPWPAPDPNHGT